LNERQTQPGEDRPVGAKQQAPSILAGGDRLLLGELSRSPGDDQPSRDEVEPYVAALLQAEHLNLLIGSGLTIGLASLGGFADGPDMTATLSLTRDLGDALEASAIATAESSGRGAPNVEDRLRIAIAAAEGLRYLADDRAVSVQDAIAAALHDLRSRVGATEAALLKAVDDPVAGAMSLRGLLMTFLGAFAGRTPTRDRLHVFTTNYDRVIEWGAELAGLRTVDRFVGSLEPVCRSSRLEVDYHYSPPGTVRDPRHLDGVLRLTKLHGSMDWRWDGTARRVVRTPLQFGSVQDADPDDILVFPNAAKDVETTFYPYADLFRDFSAALCRPHSALITYGYSFGDDHINRVIKDMLTVPSTHLLVISWDDESGRIARFAEDHRRLGQVSLMIGRSFAGLTELVDRWLPWPSAEFLLQRRAQIYRDRSPGPARLETPIPTPPQPTAGADG
jgi:SIR2-like domain